MSSAASKTRPSGGKPRGSRGKKKGAGSDKSEKNNSGAFDWVTQSAAPAKKKQTPKTQDKRKQDKNRHGKSKQGRGKENVPANAFDWVAKSESKQGKGKSKAKSTQEKKSRKPETQGCEPESKRVIILGANMSDVTLNAVSPPSVDKSKLPVFGMKPVAKPQKGNSAAVLPKKEKPAQKQKRGAPVLGTSTAAPQVFQAQPKPKPKAPKILWADRVGRMGAVKAEEEQKQESVSPVFQKEERASSGLVLPTSSQVRAALQVYKEQDEKEAPEEVSAETSAFCAVCECGLLFVADGIVNDAGAPLLFPAPSPLDVLTLPDSIMVADREAVCRPCLAMVTHLDGVGGATLAQEFFAGAESDAGVAFTWPHAKAGYERLRKLVRDHPHGAAILAAEDVQEQIDAKQVDADPRTLLELAASREVTNEANMLGDHNVRDLFRGMGLSHTVGHDVAVRRVLTVRREEKERLRQQDFRMLKYMEELHRTDAPTVEDDKAFLQHMSGSKELAGERSLLHHYDQYGDRQGLARSETRDGEGVGVTVNGGVDTFGYDRSLASDHLQHLQRLQPVQPVQQLSAPKYGQSEPVVRGGVQRTQGIDRTAYRDPYAPQQPMHAVRPSSSGNYGPPGLRSSSGPPKSNNMGAFDRFTQDYFGDGSQSRQSVSQTQVAPSQPQQQPQPQQQMPPLQVQEHYPQPQPQYSQSQVPPGMSGQVFSGVSTRFVYNEPHRFVQTGLAPHPQPQQLQHPQQQQVRHPLQMQPVQPKQEQAPQSPQESELRQLPPEHDPRLNQVGLPPGLYMQQQRTSVPPPGLYPSTHQMTPHMPMPYQMSPYEVWESSSSPQQPMPQQPMPQQPLPQQPLPQQPIPQQPIPQQPMQDSYGYQNDVLDNPAMLLQDPRTSNRSQRHQPPQMMQDPRFFSAPLQPPPPPIPQWGGSYIYQNQQ